MSSVNTAATTPSSTPQETPTVDAVATPTVTRVDGVTESKESASSSSSSSGASSTKEDHYIDYHTPSPRFSIHSPSEIASALAYLDENGYVVFSEVGSPEETSEAHDLFWTFLSGTFPSRRISRHNLASWKDIPCMQTGVIWEGGVGNSAFSWHIRSLPGVKRVFQEVWQGETNLLASMDGCGVFRPTITGSGMKSVFRENWITKSAWFHVDQNPVNKPEKECVQGLFSVFEQDHTTGGLVVVPESHLSFNSLSSFVKTKSTQDFITIPEGHFLLDRDCGAARPKLVHCKPGDFILWDSRTVHCNAPALRDQLFLQEQKAAQGDDFDSLESMWQAIKGLATDLLATAPTNITGIDPCDKKPRLQRLVSYQCMAPASKVPRNVLPMFQAARLEAVQVGVTSNHWPYEWHGGSTISDHDKHTPVKLTPYQRALVVGEGQ